MNTTRPSTADAAIAAGLVREGLLTLSVERSRTWIVAFLLKFAEDGTVATVDVVDCLRFASPHPIYAVIHSLMSDRFPESFRLVATARGVTIEESHS